MCLETPGVAPNGSLLWRTFHSILPFSERNQAFPYAPWDWNIYLCGGGDSPNPPVTFLQSSLGILIGSPKYTPTSWTCHPLKNPPIIYTYVNLPVPWGLNLGLLRISPWNRKFNKNKKHLEVPGVCCGDCSFPSTSLTPNKTSVFQLPERKGYTIPHLSSSSLYIWN